MAKYFKTVSENVYGVVSEITNKGRQLSEYLLDRHLSDYYGEEIIFISEEESRRGGGFFGDWSEKDILTPYVFGFEDERVCLEEYTREDDQEWWSGRQIPFRIYTAVHCTSNRCDSHWSESDLDFASEEEAYSWFRERFSGYKIEHRSTAIYAYTSDEDGGWWRYKMTV